jgi:FemAB-related protein (PEP-CTERM system-associated)
MSLPASAAVPAAMPPPAAPVVSLLPVGGEVAWDDFVRGRPDATFFHLSGWRRVIDRAFGHATYFFQATRDGAVTGVLPLTHIDSRLFGNALISSAFGVYGGPVAADAASRAALEAEAIALMDRVGAATLEFRTLQPIHSDWPTKDQVYVTFRKKLLPDIDANMKAIPRKQRAMVRKGIQNGLVSEVDDKVDRLHRVYAESVRNLGTPVYAKRYFRLLKEEFGAACDIVTIRHQQVPVASVLNFYFRDEVVPYYGGGTAAARHLAANDFMYWEVMRRACERGFGQFDFGRSKVGTGAFAFKKNWGFEPAPLHYQYRLAPGRSIPEVNPLNPKYRLFVKLWQRLPLAVAGLIGPRLARDLG